MAEFLDICRFVPASGGTTDWSYSVAATGYQSPAAAGAVNGTVYRYRAESADLSQWEIGYGAYNSTGAGSFARTAVLFNSSGNTSKINFSTVPQVAIVALAEDVPSLTKASNVFTGNMAAGGTLGVTSAFTASADGSQSVIGPGGAGALNAALKINGSSATGQGAYLVLSKNGTSPWFAGHVSAIEGGSNASGDFQFYNGTTTVRSLRISLTDDSVSMASTAASTSSTTGALKVAGGLGVVGDEYVGGNITLSPPASATPASNGQLTFQATSNTSLTFKYKGSDGTVRSGSITLS